jgi:hypothetical protein
MAATVRYGPALVPITGNPVLEAYLADELAAIAQLSVPDLLSLLARDNVWTGQQQFDVGDWIDNQPMVLEGDVDVFQVTETDFIQLLWNDGFNPQLTSNFLRMFTNRVLNPGQTITVGLEVGDINQTLVLVSKSADGVLMGANLNFFDERFGILFSPQTPGFANNVVLPNDPGSPVVRFDNYTPAQVDNPPGISNNTVGTMMWHGDENKTEFAHQLTMGTESAYDAGSYPKADPRVAIRTGAPSSANAGAGEWNGDWLNFVIADVNDIDNVNDPVRFNGSQIQWEEDSATYPDNGRFKVFEPVIAAMYIDPGTTQPTVPTGAPIVFTNGTGFVGNSTAITPSAAIDLTNGFLEVREGGIYQLAAMGSVDMGTGGTATFQLQTQVDFGAWTNATGLVSAVSTGNQNQFATFSITGYVPVQPPTTNTRLRILVTNSNGNTQILACQFWVKRDYGI